MKYLLGLLIALEIQEGQSWLSSSAVTSLRSPTTALHVLSTDILGSKAPYMNPAALPPERNRDANSTHRLSRLQIQKAINDIKRFVEHRLEDDMNLTKVNTINTYCPSYMMLCQQGDSKRCNLSIYFSMWHHSPSCEVQE